MTWFQRLCRCTATGMVLCAVAGSWSTMAKTWTADPNAEPGDPGYYRDLAGKLAPGDTLELPAGTYRDRLDLSGKRGQPGAWITITGPSTGDPAVITTDSACCNTVQLGDNAYLRIRHLTIDSRSVAMEESLDGIKAMGGSTHDITIEDCRLIGNDYHQQTVGISTKSTAWNWVVRRNVIDGAGTGMYFGNSTGAAPFVAGIIEGNLVVDPIGYGLQIKHQNPYDAPAGMPPGPHRTVIRNNVFIKRTGVADFEPSRVDGERPTVLVGGFPESGTGADDMYEIYANFFYKNPDDSQIQAAGRVAVHDNVFVGPTWTAVRFQNHKTPLRVAYAYNNTVYGGQQGIWFGTAAADDDAVVGNLVFSGQPIGGPLRAANRKDNIEASFAAAAEYVVNPSMVLGDMDFYPLPDKATGSPLDLAKFANHVDHDRDFNGSSKGDRRFRGAYAGDGANPGWTLDEERKVGGPSGQPGGGDPDPPATPTNLRVVD